MTRYADAQSFLTAYAASSGITPEALTSRGRYVTECACGYEHCEGWQLAYPDDYKQETPNE